jgi:hypothetical protein
MANIDLAALRDGKWYSIIRKHPRMHYNAKWDAESEVFWWATSPNESPMSHYIDATNVDEVLHDLGDPPAGESWI